MAEAHTIDLAAAGTVLGREQVGGKAAALGKLLRAGLSVPEGFVVPWHVFDRPDGSWRTEVQARCRDLGTSVAVRSSASVEDRPDAAAPGLFRTVRRVQVNEVDSAIEQVRCSLVERSVESYCVARRLQTNALRMSVIVQTDIADAKWYGVAYTREPDSPDSPHMLIEAFDGGRGRGVRLRLDRVAGAASAAPLGLDLCDSLRDQALAAERAISATRGADVEWVIDHDNHLWLVQARPIVHSGRPTRLSPPPVLFEFSKGDDRVWSWDVTHDPDPLSPAQIGLVRRVERLGVGALSMRVVGGYLYAAPKQRAQTAPRTAEDLDELYHKRVLPAANAALAPLESDRTDVALLEALTAYDKVYSHYAGALSPALSHARGALGTFLSQTIGETRPETLSARMLDDRIADHLTARIERVACDDQPIESLHAYAAPMSPAWDVAAPSYAEDPDPIERAVRAERTRVGLRELPTSDVEDTRRAVIEKLPDDERGTFHRLLALAARAKELGEADDHLFFRAQTVVRRALLAVATRWKISSEDIFFLPLADVIALCAEDRNPTDTWVSRCAAKHRAEREHQLRWAMPLAICGGRALALPQHASGENHFRGVGFGGQATGTVVRVGDLGETPPLPPDAIVVASALSPALVFAVEGARALVSAYGGLLGHGAAMARELGIPCVVECRGAWRLLANGERVLVDGAAGLVVRVCD